MTSARWVSTTVRPEPRAKTRQRADDPMGEPEREADHEDTRDHADAQDVAQQVQLDGLQADDLGRPVPENMVADPVLNDEDDAQHHDGVYHEHLERKEELVLPIDDRRSPGKPAALLA